MQPERGGVQREFLASLPNLTEQVEQLGITACPSQEMATANREIVIVGDRGFSLGRGPIYQVVGSERFHLFRFPRAQVLFLDNV